jgi:hypothetical protein
MTSKKKIAWCFYGQPRDYATGHSTVMKTLEPYKDTIEVDFFYHTWFDKSLVGTYYKISPWRNIPQEILLIKEDIPEQLEKLYNPKGCCYDSPGDFVTDEILNSKLFNLSHDSCKKNVNNTISQFISRSKVYDLFYEYSTSTNTTYDFVIETRFDLYNPITIDFFSIDPLKFYFRKYNVHAIPYLNDNIVIMGVENFKKFSSVYKNFSKLVNNTTLIQKFNEKYVEGFLYFNPEELILLNLFFYHENIIDDFVVYRDDIPSFF